MYRTAEQCRERNLEFIRVHLDLTIYKFADNLEISPSQLSQLIGPSRRKNIGPEVARTLEKAMDVPTGFLDQDHQNAVLLTWIHRIRETMARRKDTGGIMSKFLPGEVSEAAMHAANKLIRVRKPRAKNKNQRKTPPVRNVKKHARERSRAASQ